MQHPFINNKLDIKPVRDLLLEYHAEVFEEDFDEPEEVSRIIVVILLDLSKGNVPRVVIDYLE